MILIQGGTVVDPKNGRNGAFDLLIEQGAIKAVEPRGVLSKKAGIEVIEARGQLVMPGAIDLHVHLREPGFEWKETIASGTEAAVLGGYTTVCCMPNTSPVNDHAEITDSILQKAALAGRASVLPIGAISKGLKGIELSALTELHRSGCVAFSDDGEPVHNAGLMRRAIEWCAAWGVPLACHEEDKHLSCGGVANEGSLALQMGLPGWHPVAEEVMIARDIELARAFKGKIHFCHVTTARGVELIRRAKSDGIAVTAEVTPHHLTMNEEAIDGYNTNAKMSPPLRTAADSQALLDGLLDGTIDCVASDHAPHDLDTKRVEFGRASFGIIGIQTALSVLFRLVKEEKLSLERAVAVSSYGPSRAFGLSDRGSFAPGTRADVTLVDTDAEWSFDRSSNHSKSSNSPLLGSSRLGMVKTVLVAGKVVVRNSKLEGN